MPKIKTILTKLFISIFLIGGLFAVNSFFAEKISGNGLLEGLVHAEPNTPATYGESVKDAPASQQDKSMESFAQTLETLLRMIYVILWPLIWIAGKSLDNDLVYGGAIHLDKYLWMFWNIMKNFANYIMGFVFILSILMYFFTNGKGGKSAWNAHPKDIIKKLLIGSIAIQSSWFLMGALIDISTVLTYSVGALPLNIVKMDTLGQKPVLIPDITWNTQSSSGEQFSVKYSCGNMTMVQCAFSGSEFDQNTFDSLRSKIPSASSEACIMGGKAYCIEGNGNSCQKGLKQLLGKGSNAIPACPADNKSFQEDPKTSSFLDLSSAELKNTGANGSGTGNVCSSTISSIVDKSKAGMTGPLYTLYASLLNISEFSVTSSSKTAGTLGFQFMLQAMVAFALLIPLITLVVVLIMRVVILWVVIGFSPMIFLAQIFSFKMGGENYNLKNIISLIFLPAVTVFALSISIIFLSVLQSSSPGSESNLGSNLYKTLNMRQCTEAGNMCYVNVNTGVKTCIGQPKKSIGEFIDFVPWLLINFMGIGLMWTIVFAALKTSKITAKVVDNFEKFGSNMAKSAPIIPFLPGGSWAGISSIPSAMSSIATSKVGGESAETQGLIKKLFPGDSSSGSGGSSPGSGAGTAPSTPSVGAYSVPAGASPIDVASTYVRNNGGPAGSGNLNARDITNDVVSRMIGQGVSYTDVEKATGDIGNKYDTQRIDAAITGSRNNKKISNTVFYDSSSNTVFNKEGNIWKPYKINITTKDGLDGLVNYCNTKWNVKTMSDFNNFGIGYNISGINGKTYEIKESGGKLTGSLK